MYKRLSTVAAAAAALGFYGLLAAPSSAATCSAFALANGIQPNAGCFVGDTNNDAPPPPPAQVNDQQFFGFSDWNFLGKDDGTFNTFLTGNAQSGTWNIDASLWDTYANIMIVLKDGVDTFITGYLLVADSTSGTYTSPFPGPNGNSKDISHASLYGEGVGGGGGGGGNVPLPGAVYLFGTALAGLGVLGRRRRAA